MRTWLGAERCKISRAYTCMMLLYGIPVLDITNFAETTTVLAVIVHEHMAYDISIDL